MAGFQGTVFSNFYPAPVRLLDGLDYPPDCEYPTVEHAYQAAKTLHPHERERVRDAATPGKAKRLGREVTMRPDWEAVKLSVMWGLLWQKFAPGTAPYATLLATGEEELVEWNTWGDRF